MNHHNQRLSALLTALLALAMLLMLPLLPVSASARSDRMRELPSRRLLSIEIENGKVTDSDGIIGNSLHGADARHPSRHHRHVRGMANPARSAEGILHHAAQGAEQVADRAIDGVKEAADDVIDGVKDAAERAGDALTKRENDVRTDENTATSPQQAESSSGVIGWVVAVLILLAIALVVLALLPKKQRSRH